MVSTVTPGGIPPIGRASNHETADDGKIRRADTRGTGPADGGPRPPGGHPLRVGLGNRRHRARAEPQRRLRGARSRAGSLLRPAAVAASGD